jgi:hypothetical protein
MKTEDEDDWNGIRTGSRNEFVKVEVEEYEMSVRNWDSKVGREWR